MMEDFNFAHPIWKPELTDEELSEGGCEFLYKSVIDDAYPTFEEFKESQDAIDKAYFESLSPGHISTLSHQTVLESMRTLYGDKFDNSFIFEHVTRIERELLYDKVSPSTAAGDVYEHCRRFFDSELAYNHEVYGVSDDE